MLAAHAVRVVRLFAISKAVALICHFMIIAAFIAMIKGVLTIEATVITPLGMLTSVSRCKFL